MFTEQLNQEFKLTPAQIAFYKENSYIKLKNVLSAEIINHFNTIISAKVDELNMEGIPLDEKDTYGKAFLQLHNLWREDDKIKPLVFSKRLAMIAADLMQIDGVRLYHDQALFKEAGGGITPWHADQYYWPVSSDKTVTAWIPLQETFLDMGPLEFSAGSNKILEGRDLVIGDDSEIQINRNLKINDFKHIIEPFDIGEISFHSGWIFHRAGANISNKMRKVMTIIYLDKDMLLSEPKNSAQKLDRETWCPGVATGKNIDSPLNPILS